MTERDTGRHVPNNWITIFNLFVTLPNCAIKCKVIGKHINRGTGYRLEILVQYNFFWNGKSTEKDVKKVIDSVEKRTKNCTK